MHARCWRSTARILCARQVRVSCGGSVSESSFQKVCRKPKFCGVRSGGRFPQSTFGILYSKADLHPGILNCESASIHAAVQPCAKLSLKVPQDCPLHFLLDVTPSFRRSEEADGDGILQPMLGSGATHRLLPLKWLAPEQAAHSRRNRFKAASGSTVRALLYNNVIYCVTVSRPLISVGQLKAMLDIHFVWSDSAPLLGLRRWSHIRFGRIFHDSPFARDRNS